jgi:hypothetical protein
MNERKPESGRKSALNFLFHREFPTVGNMGGIYLGHAHLRQSLGDDYLDQFPPGTQFKLKLEAGRIVLVKI